MEAALPAIGVILPSSNRTVERAARQILRDRPELDICFARVPYAGHPVDGYDLQAFRSAAAMLAEARPGIIVWNATRGASLGFDPDRALCAMIEAETGIRATSMPLLLLDLLRAKGIERVAVIDQGDAAHVRHLRSTFGHEGVEIIADVSLGIMENYAATWTKRETLETAIVGLAERKPDAVLVWSTNLPGYDLIRTLETRVGIPILDSAAIGLTEGAARVVSIQH